MRAEDEDDLDFDEADLPKVNKKIVNDASTQTDADAAQREEQVNRFSNMFQHVSSSSVCTGHQD